MACVCVFFPMLINVMSVTQHVDGAGKVDGSVVVALPTEHPFQGGGLTFWDGKTVDPATGQSQPLETHYDTRSGDVAFIDRYDVGGFFALVVVVWWAHIWQLFLCLTGRFGTKRIPSPRVPAGP